MEEHNLKLVIDALVSFIIVICFYFALNPLLAVPNLAIPIFFIGVALSILGFYSLYNNNVKIGLTLIMIGADFIGTVIVTLPLF